MHDENPARLKLLRRNLIRLLHRGDEFIVRQASNCLSAINCVNKFYLPNKPPKKRDKKANAKHDYISRLAAHFTLAVVLSVMIPLTPTLRSHDTPPNRYGRTSIRWKALYCESLSADALKSGESGWPVSDCAQPEV